MKQTVSLLIAFYWLLTCTVPTASQDVQEKKDAPTFKLTAMDGTVYDLTALRGKVVVLNIWFIACPPCIAEMPELNRIVDHYRDQEVVFVAPTWDKKADLQKFLQKSSFKYQVVPDAAQLIFSSYSAKGDSVGFPQHIVIDRDGKIDMWEMGSSGIGKLRERLRALTGK